MAQKHPLQQILAPLLLPLSWLYAFAMKVRAFLYSKNILKQNKALIPVICIGNISWGGTGKSPVTDYLINYFRKHQKKVALLTRGYGFKSSIYPLILKEKEHNLEQALPDEALMLAQKHPDISILIDPLRSRAVQFIQKSNNGNKIANTCHTYKKKSVFLKNHFYKERFPRLYARFFVHEVYGKTPMRGLGGNHFPQKKKEDKKNFLHEKKSPSYNPQKNFVEADYILMDDGFQHLALKRDFDFVLLDKEDMEAQNSWLWSKKSRWGQVLPLGTWREGEKALERASIFLLKCPQNEWESLRPHAQKYAKKYHKSLAVFEIKVDTLSNIYTENIYSLSSFPYTDYTLICGVGNPLQVEKSVYDYLKIPPSQSFFYQDHHDFQQEEAKLKKILQEKTIICTEKDAVKLKLLNLNQENFPILSLKSHVEFYAFEAQESTASNFEKWLEQKFFP